MLPTGNQYTQAIANYTQNKQVYVPPIKDESQTSQSFQNWDYKTSYTNPDGESLPAGALGWRPDGTPDFGTGFDGWYKKARYNFQNAWLKGWNQGEELNKSNGYSTDILPRFTSSVEATKAIFGEALFGGLSILGTTAQFTEQLAGSVGLFARDLSQGKPTTDPNYWKNNWEVSRLAYNIVVDGFKGKGDEIRNEFIQRMQEGERPDLIAEDMQIKGKANPWIELGGQLLFDPLNADLFANWFGKNRKTLSVINQVKKDFSTFENPELARIFTETDRGANVLRATDTFQTALRLHQETVGATDKMLEALRVPGKLKIAGELPERARQYAMLIPDSRRLALSNRMGAVVESILKFTGGDPNATLDVLDAMAKSMSKDPAIAAEGFKTITEFKNPAILLSPAGNELTATAGKMLEKYGNDWLRVISETKTPEELGSLLLKRLNSTLDELYPSATNMLKAMDAVKKGEQVTEEVRRLAQLGEKMTPVERTIARMHNSAQKGIVGALNRGFANIYMNWNPGYMFRNGLQNNLQIFLDYGPSAMLGSSDGFLENASKFHGSQLSAPGFKVSMAATGAEELVSHPKTGILEAAKAIVEKRGIKAGNEVIETNAAHRVIGYTYTKTFKDALQPLVKSLEKDERFSGISQDVWKLLESEIYKNFGDVNAALDAVREAHGSGAINLFRSYNNVPLGLQDFFLQSGVDRKVIDRILNAGSREEALAAVDDLFNQFDTAAQGAALDGLNGVPGEPLTDLMNIAREDGYVSTPRGLLINAQFEVNKQAISSVTNVILHVIRDSGAQGVPIPPGIFKELKLTPLMEWGASTSDELKAIRNAIFATRDTLTDGNILRKWESMKRVLPLGDAPSTKTEAMRQIWEAFIKYQSESWTEARGISLSNAMEFLNRAEQAGVNLDPLYRTSVQEAVDYADKWKNISIGEYGLIQREENTALQGTRASQIAALAEKYGISSATYAGIPKDQYLLNIINKYAKVDFKGLEDPISLETASKAFAKKTGMAEISVSQKAAEHLIPPYIDGTMPTYARVLESSNLQLARKTMQEYVTENFGKIRTFASDPVLEGRLRLLAPELENRLNTIRLVSQQTAQEMRNFTLLNYGQKTYWDIAAAYVMPYGLWYKNTYNNWLQRIVYDPAIFAGYAKYKQAMLTTHAGLPDWWKQNVEVDNILGIPLKNPLFFNLEATLNPLNGIVGTDFNDLQKVTDWWTYTLDQVGKVGPSVWTPISIITGLILRAQGQQEAGNAWIGRVIPQTALIKTLTGKELDPSVGLLMNGYDKYERRRIGRALPELVGQKLPDGTIITREMIIEADRTQSGPIWDMAAKLANNYRAAGQTISTLFGVGFKARSRQDMMIDQFDSDYQKLIAMRKGNYLSGEDFRNQLALLGQKYPFMDTVLLSRQFGEERDMAYAYNILGRLPPGTANDLLEKVGVRPEAVDRFYKNKGDMSTWTEGDKMRFMAAMVDLGAITKIPETATRQEWNQARSTYNHMNEKLKAQFGEETYNQLQDYYAASDKGKGSAFLDQNPNVARLLDARTAYIATTPILNQYYGGIQTLEQYYMNVVRGTLRKKYGADIYEAYYAYLDALDPKTKKSILSQYPQIKAFVKEKNAWQEVVNRKVSEMASRLPNQPNVPIGNAQSPTQTVLGEQLSAPGHVPAQQLLSEMSPAMQELLRQYFAEGQDLPYPAIQQLNFIGERYGLSSNEILQILGSGQ